MAFKKQNLARTPLGYRNGQYRSRWTYYTPDAFATVDDNDYFLDYGPLGNDQMQHGDEVVVVSGTAGAEVTTLARVAITAGPPPVINVTKTITVV